MSLEPLITVTGLRAGYRDAAGGIEVLRGVELELAPGEMVLLLGPNGSGKTTLLRCLAGTVPASAGEIVLFGRAVGDWSRIELARRVAVLPQSLELPDGFTVAELVEMGRTPHAARTFGSDATDLAAVERALTDADAADLADRYPAGLSGGERQRVLVAMALAQEPRLLLLDEPTLHLDVAHQAGLLSTLERLRRSRDLAVIAVVHDLTLASASGARAAVLADGRIVADGPPDEVLSVDLVRGWFGLSMEEARTRDGARYLVPRRMNLPASARVSLSRLTEGGEIPPARLSAPSSGGHSAENREDPG